MENKRKQINFYVVLTLAISFTAVCLLSGVLLLFFNYYNVTSQSKAAGNNSVNTLKEHRVLFISSYSVEDTVVDLEYKGLQSVFRNNSVILDCEFMDTKKYNTAQNLHNFYTALSYKMSQSSRYSAVIAADDAALNFVSKYYDDLFKNTPVVFFGVNQVDFARQAGLNPNITGFTEEFDFGLLLDLAVKQRQNISSVTVIYDNSETGNGDIKQYKACTADYSDISFDFINMAQFTILELGSYLRKLDDTSIVMCLDAHTDKYNNTYTTKELCEYISFNCSQPVYTRLNGAVGNGFLGGNIYDFEKAGKNTAELVLKIILGEKDIRNIDVIRDSSATLCFDYNLLKKYKISEASLPKDTVIVNRPNSYWQKNQNILFPFVLIVTSLILMIIILVEECIRTRYYSIALSTSKKKFEYMAEHDFLTKLPNYHSIRREIEKLLVLTKPFTIVKISIDNFNSLKNFYGQDFSDLASREIARHLASFCERKDYYASRLESGEFLLVMRGILLDRYSVEIDDVKTLLSLPVEYRNNGFVIKTSIGIKPVSSFENSCDQIMADVDLALRQSESTGKNKYTFFNSSMRQNLEEFKEINDLLEEACRNEEYTVLYQPQIDIADGSIHGYEALVRLPTRNLYPDKFIPIAEQTGLISAIGRIVTKKVIQQLALWRVRGKPLYPVAINFSVGQLEDVGYIDYLKNLLDEYDIDPSLIEIEITESLFLDNDRASKALFEKLKNVGVKLALDDFGTGYSSLVYLTYLPVSTVKIDKTLTDTYLPGDKDSLIRAIINMVHGLGMTLTVEGVEEKWQLEKLCNLGCDTIQGYYFSKPVDAEQIENFSVAI